MKILSFYTKTPSENLQKDLDFIYYGKSCLIIEK